MKMQGPMSPGKSHTYPHSSTPSSTRASRGTGEYSAISLVLNVLLLGHFILGGPAPLGWEPYQFTWMSVYPDCNVPVDCNATSTGKDPKEILLLGDSMLRFFVDAICRKLGGLAEIDPTEKYDTPSNCSIDGGFHVTHKHLPGLNPQPPYWQAHRHDGSNATTRFHQIMQALPRRPNVVVVNGGLWDQARHTMLTKPTAVVEGEHQYLTLTALQEFRANLESFMRLVDSALPGAQKVFMTTTMSPAHRNRWERVNNLMLSGFNAVGTSTAVKLGWPVLDAALYQMGFENPAYYIRDNVHPIVEVFQTWWHALSHHICS